MFASSNRTINPTEINDLMAFALTNLFVKKLNIDPNNVPIETDKSGISNIKTPNRKK